MLPAASNNVQVGFQPVPPLRYLPLALLLLGVFLLYSNVVDDLDLWWHLKYGQYIYEHHALLKEDPFSFTSTQEFPISSHVDYKNYSGEIPSKSRVQWAYLFLQRYSWCSQLILYLAYLAGGFTGIGILKSAVFSLTFGIIYAAMIRRGANHPASFFVVCLIAVIGLDFNYARPQMFSFFLFALLLSVLDISRTHKKYCLWLPVIMFVWANVHGGFIVGAAVIFAFTFGETLKYMLRNYFGRAVPSLPDKKHLQWLFAGLIAASAASLVNPNGYEAYLSPFLITQNQLAVEEFQRPMLYEYHAFWVMLALVIVSIAVLLFLKKLDITDVCIGLLLIIPSLRIIRHIIFFALGCGGFLATALTIMGMMIKEARFFRFMGEKWPWVRSIATVVVVISCLGGFIANADIGGMLKFDTRAKRYPEGAVEFIKANQIPGHMFNLYNWGGYLIWRLSPQYKVFIDGRFLNEYVFMDYSAALKGYISKDAGYPLWKKILDRYEVNFLVLSAVSSEGILIPLVDVLSNDDDWKLIYADGTSVIFLRNTTDNKMILDEYVLSKDTLIDQVIRECERGIKDTPATWGYYETLGYAYVKKNRNQDALRMFNRYLEMNPYNAEVRNLRDLLARYPR